MKNSRLNEFTGKSFERYLRKISHGIFWSSNLFRSQYFKIDVLDVFSRIAELCKKLHWCIDSVSINPGNDLYMIWFSHKKVMEMTTILMSFP